MSSGLRTARRGTLYLTLNGVSAVFSTMRSSSDVVNCLLFVAFDISDEDIQQTLPGTLEAFEAGVSLPLCGPGCNAPTRAYYF